MIPLLAQALPEFVRWSAPHLWAVTITVLTAAALLLLGSKQSERKRHLICRVLACIVAVQFIGEYTWRAFSDAYGPWRYNLPLHFCSLMLIVAFIALWWRAHWACAMVYFGVLTASIQALITPDMAAGYPSIAFFIFFISHGLLLVIALAIPVLLRWRARGWDDLRTLLLMDLYVICIIPVNIWLGTNYGYTQGSPVEGCLLDYLGPAPWYYLWVQLPVLAVFRLMMLPVHDSREA